MAILVKPYNEEEEKVLLAFLNSLHYEYVSAKIDILSPNDEKRQPLEEYNNEIAEA